MYSNERIAVSVHKKTQVQDKLYDCDGRHQYSTSTYESLEM